MVRMFLNCLIFLRLQILCQVPNKLLSKCIFYSDYFDIDDPMWNCQHCGAMMWYDERIEKEKKRTVPKFSMCCLQGKIYLPPPEEETPQILKDLFLKHDSKSKLFLKHIRSFNMMFSFTSMGGNIVKEVNDGNGPPMFVMSGENYHQIGSLLPTPGSRPKFAQLYIYDTENEVDNRMLAVRYG